MLDQILNSPSFNYMQRGMEAANLRQEVISNNIANVNTPHFKRSDVVFETLLAKELGMGEDKNKLKMVRTRDKHLPQAMSSKAEAAIHLDDTTTKADLRIRSYTDSSGFSYRLDGNNVDIDFEMADLAKNQIYYNAMAKKLGGYIQGVKNVISSK